MTVIKNTPLNLRFAIATALSAAAVLSSAPLHAADSAPSALEEIVVTARKRTENLQDVPLSIDVFTKKDLANLAITKFEDYATLTPSISFISAGPSSQTLVMRGVSDGSNPNYSNTAATAFLIDDMSMNYYGALPDLHFYDLEQIEILNGPQGTTYGAGAMSGAVRFITHKPDPKAFSAGIDLDGGKIDGGGNNLVTEGFINLPIIEGKSAIRISAYNAYHGGFINNVLTTRQWVNGTVSDNSQWAGNNYNTENTQGARIAYGQEFNDAWKASLTYGYQRQLTRGSWDQNLGKGGVRNVQRFGPEFRRNYTKTLDFHLDGDVGIADLVFASTYWAEETRQVNEYSEYMQYVNTPTITPESRQGFTCLTDPFWSVALSGDPNSTPAAFSGCNVPTLWYDYDTHVERWSNELRLQSKSGGQAHWIAGLYWEKTRDLYSDYFHMPGLQTASQGWQFYNTYYNQVTTPPGADDWYSYIARSDYLQTTEFADINFDVTDRFNIEAGLVRFHSDFTNFAYGGYWYAPQLPSTKGGSSNKWNGKLGASYKAADHLLLYADFAQGFRDGGVNGGLPASCIKLGAPTKFIPDTVNNFEVGWKSTRLQGRFLWNGALYYMPWKNLQTSLFDPDICLASSFNANIGDARIYGAESNITFKANEFLTLETSASYNDAHIVSNSFVNSKFQVNVGERLPYVPYFNFSANARYEMPINDTFKGYVQFDIAHKGNMWNDLRANGANGLPSGQSNGLERALQPSYSIMNLRFGLNQTDALWMTEIYISNLANKNAVIYTNAGNFDKRQTVSEPRVFGVRLNYRFGAKEK